MTETWTILKLINWTTSYFNSHNIDSPRLTSEILLAHCLNISKLTLYLEFDRPLNKKELNQYKTLIKRRINKEPVAYIVNNKDFWSMSFEVNSFVLIPRPETETLVEKALSFLSENETCDEKKKILELGTGSGALILSIASERPMHKYFATDISFDSIKIAKINTKKNNLLQKVNFILGDWFLPINNKLNMFDMILSNPPYIKTKCMKTLQPEIFMHEPARALDGGEDGLIAIRKIIQGASSYLKPNGILIIEIGHDQKKDVQNIVDNTSLYHDVTFKKDLCGIDRVVFMKKN